MAKVSPRTKNDNLNEWKGIISEVEALQKENTELRAQVQELTRQVREVVEKKGVDTLADKGEEVTDEGTKVTEDATTLPDNTTKVTDDTTKLTEPEDEKQLQEKLDKMTEENKLLKIILQEGSNLVTDFKKLLQENKRAEKKNVLSTTSIPHQSSTPPVAPGETLHPRNAALQADAERISPCERRERKLYPAACQGSHPYREEAVVISPLFPGASLYPGDGATGGDATFGVTGGQRSNKGSKAGLGRDMTVK
ncbi:hypothetical protein Bbelb_418370 [Branchiostoma belcheri]|nr:hypothetical protein Bbelb_418370 [Branchiostoma belcheri]